MSPDLPYFQPFGDWRLLSPATHSVGGVLSWGLLFGLAMWALWRAGARPLHDLVPAAVRGRWHPAGWPTTRRGWVLAAVAVVVGAATHVVWDEFTHAGRFGVAYLPALAASYPTPLGDLPGFRILQYASSVAGLLILGWVGLRQPVRDPGPRPRPRLARTAAWLVPAVAVVAAAARLLALDDLGAPRVVAFAGITAAIGAAAVIAILVTAAHALTTRPGPASTPR